MKKTYTEAKQISERLGVYFSEHLGWDDSGLDIEIESPRDEPPDNLISVAQKSGVNIYLSTATGKKRKKRIRRGTIKKTNGSGQNIIVFISGVFWEWYYKDKFVLTMPDTVPDIKFESNEKDLVLSIVYQRIKSYYDRDKHLMKNVKV